ncbi:hypothetical protein ACF08M_01135 [Streptomyces sp. NPDC015032]|uniref:hypothetical protein n=1 Tax=Streptomyces sp. NPDC015032 TaxID=3364937 RepID=UPI0036FAC7BE
MGPGQLVGERTGRGVQAGQAEHHREGDDALLGPVVQIAFDAAAFRLEGVDQTDAGAGEFPQAGVQVSRLASEQEAGQFRPRSGQQAQ